MESNRQNGLFGPFLAAGITVAGMLIASGCANWASGGGGNGIDDPIVDPVNKAPVIVGNTISASVLNPETSQSVKLAITAVDPEDEALTFAWDDGNAGAGVFDGSGASVFWTTTEAGPYTISVTVSDPDLLTASATTSLTVTQAAAPPGPNAAPVFDAAGISKDVTTPVAGQKIIFAAQASDPDGDPLQFIWEDSTGANNFFDESVGEDGKAKASWRFDTAGSYTITAIANDGKGASKVISAVMEVTANVSLAALPATFEFKGAEFCSSCHSDIYDSYVLTGHATREDEMQAAGLGRLESCRECHNVGYQNGGFIDYEVTPQFANVQCESCHGTGVGHPANGPLPNWFDEPAETCGKCHTDAHHPTFDEWETSLHATFDLEASNATRTSCIKCHNGEWFVRIQINGEDPPAENLALGTHITCATCHDPHEATHENQLRVDPAATIILPFDDTPVNGGSANTCLSCHDGRRNRGNLDTFVTSGGHGFHPNSQGPMLYGIGGVEWPGFEYDTQHPHNTWNEEKCITCHMYTKEFEGAESPAIVGHSFIPKIESCNVCHTFQNAEEMEAYKAEYQNETLALLEEFEELWPAQWKTVVDGVTTIHEQPDSADPPTFDGPPLDDPLGNQYRECLWNYEYIEADSSKGIHNPAYGRALLNSAIAKLTELNAI
jgi:hypothetical protein